MSGHSVRKEREPGLGILAARLLFAVQDELFAQLTLRGHQELRPSHGVVLAHLDRNGNRATELAALSGRHKQIVGRAVDELEALGYVERRPDPADRRAKLVLPTERGRAVIALSDRLMLEIEQQVGAAIGAGPYAEFHATLIAAADALRTSSGR